MATNSLVDTINLIVPFCRYMKADQGTNQNPITGIGSIVRNIILAAPMQWKFNRLENNALTTVIGQQDYVVTITNLGFVEAASISDGKAFYQIKDIWNNQPLSKSTTPGRPMGLSVQNDLGNDQYTIRLSPVPDAIYNVNIVYQQSPVKFVATTDLWFPIPDSFSDVYNNLCLGYYMDSCQDPRAPQYISRGIAGLLARSQGLSQMDKAVFAASYMNYTAAELLNQLKVQQGQQAQGAR